MEYPFKDLLPLDEVLAREGYYKDWTHLDPEVFYSLTQISNFIKTKGYGVDVRLLIAQLAEHFGLKTTQVVDLANLLQQEFTNLEGVTQSFTNNINSLVAQMEADKNTIVANATVDSEVILARGSKATLGQRLNETDSYIANMHITNVINHGGKGDDSTDNSPAINSAIASLPNGGVIEFPEGTFLFKSAFNIPEGITIRGRGYSTILKRGFTGDLIPDMRGKSSIQELFIDGNSSVYGEGRGIVFANPISPKSSLKSVDMRHFSSPCVYFEEDAGGQFMASNCFFYPDNNDTPAVKMVGDTDGASSKHFTDCESSGTLYDFGNCGDVYINGGFTQGLVFGTNATKIMINNMRWGNVDGRRFLIQGSSHKISNIVSAVRVDINGSHITFSGEVPDYDIKIISGTNNDIQIRGNRPYDCIVEGSIRNPTLGNGDLKAYYNRSGNIVKAMIQLRVGSTTDMGEGYLSFSLPYPDFLGVAQVCGVGITQGGTQDIQFTLRAIPGNQKVELFYVGDQGVIIRLKGDSPIFKENTIIRLTADYSTP